MILGVVNAIPIPAPAIDWLAIAPEIALAAAGIAIVLLRSLARRSRLVYPFSMAIAVVGVFAAAIPLIGQWHRVEKDGPYVALSKMIAIDGFAVFLGAVVLIATFLALLLSAGFVERARMDGPEYLALIMLSATGMLAMTSANDLVVVFVALEVLSIPLYVLAAFDRRRIESQEAGLKYFVLGALASAIFLYGVAFTYGATGTTSLSGITDFLARNTLLDEGALLIGLGLMLVGLGFKISAVPFHTWTPDVYQGAPTPVTAFMASATKAAAFAALLRILATAFTDWRTDWQPLLWALSVLCLLVGSIAAIVQDDVKRMLAYSSIAHAGYVLMAFQTGTDRGLAAALFYLLVYTFLVVGSFAVVAVIARKGDDRHSLREYRGLAASNPLLAGLLTLFLLAQTGVPLTGGFVAKLGVFAAAVDANEYALALIGALAAAISAFVYLRIVVTMYAPDVTDDDPLPNTGRLRIDAGTATALALAVVGVLVLGILPADFLRWAQQATLIF